MFFMATYSFLCCGRPKIYERRLSAIEFDQGYGHVHLLN
jgi:hypothetical protein